MIMRQNPTPWLRCPILSKHYSNIGLTSYAGEAWSRHIYIYHIGIQRIISNDAVGNPRSNAISPSLGPPILRPIAQISIAGLGFTGGSSCSGACGSERYEHALPNVLA